MAQLVTAQRALAHSVIRTLRAAGYEAYLAGGCVRDALLGREPADFDVATGARPEQVEELFPHTIPVGKAFGVVIVAEPGASKIQVEVATFRNDGAYVDGRRPTSVVFSSAREDAERRDFTINGMFMDPFTGEVLDYVGGKADLAAGVIRAIGDAERRFEEDKLRMLRAVRFACRFGFAVDASTEAAVAKLAPKIVAVSAERVRDELNHMLSGMARGRALRMLMETGLLEQVLPEFTHSLAGDPSLFGRTSAMLDLMDRDTASRVLAWSVLLHGVDAEAAAGCNELLAEDFKAGVASASPAHRLGRVGWRVMWRLKQTRAESEGVDEVLRGLGEFRRARELGLAELKRFLRRKNAKALLELEKLRALAAPDAQTRDTMAVHTFCLQQLDEFERAGQQNPAEGLNPPMLLDGNDLARAGIAAGPAFKVILHELETAVLERKVTTKEAALELALTIHLRLSQEGKA